MEAPPTNTLTERPPVSLVLKHSFSVFSGVFFLCCFFCSPTAATTSSPESVVAYDTDSPQDSEGAPCVGPWGCSEHSELLCEYCAEPQPPLFSSAGRFPRGLFSMSGLSRQLFFSRERGGAGGGATEVRGSFCNHGIKHLKR